MSFLSGLGSLGGVTKLLDPGALVKDVVNGFLPKDMKVVGDVAGAVVDFKTGNFIGAAQLGMDAVKDLPQAAKTLQGGAAGGSNNAQSLVAKGGGSNLDPPPPAASQGGKPLDVGGLFAAIEKLTTLLTGLLDKKGAGAGQASAQPDGGAKAQGNTPTDSTRSSTKTDGTANSAPSDSTSSSSSRRGEHVHRHSHTQSGWRQPPSANPHAETRPSGWTGEPRTAAEARPSGWRGEPRTAAAATNPRAATNLPATSNAGAPTSAAASPPSQPTPAANGATAASDARPASAPSKGETITSLDQIKGMSDSAIRDAVINGRISPEVAKDQTAMMVLQQRMQAIAEMNNLMTGMLRALHDMQMAVIQNIRI